MVRYFLVHFLNFEVVLDPNYSHLQRVKTLQSNFCNTKNLWTK